MCLSATALAASIPHLTTKAGRSLVGTGLGALVHACTVNTSDGPCACDIGCMVDPEPAYEFHGGFALVIANNNVSSSEVTVTPSQTQPGLLATAVPYSMPPPPTAYTRMDQHSSQLVCTL